MQDELLVDPRRLVRFLVIRRATRVAEWACAVPMPGCRQKQLLDESAFIRQAATVSMLRWSIRCLRLRRQPAWYVEGRSRQRAYRRHR